MYGLVDCNNFFVSCERVFNPALRRKPVAVLSNNDGCIVALSNEAKALGLKRGDPYFKVKHICETSEAFTMSGNHRLYGDMSSRVMATLSAMVPEIEIYSIDEAFLHLDGIATDKLNETGHDIVRRVYRDTGIPTSLGIAPTKTLAKVAAHFAKRYQGYHAVCMINDDTSRRKALELTEIGEVWGIGRRLRRKFESLGIANALQFADMPREKVERMMNVIGIRTWRELNGEPCINHDIDTSRKQLCCSRSFNTMISDFDSLRKSIVIFASVISRKLREQRLAAVSISVFIHTNAYRDDLEQYFNSSHRKLAEASSDTIAITEAAVNCLESIYRQGYSYKKAGIMVSETIDQSAVRRSLFTDDNDRQRRRRLMQVLDNVNATSVAHDTLHIASYEPIDSLVRGEHRSRMYSTRLSDIITVKTSINASVNGL